MNEWRYNATTAWWFYHPSNGPCWGFIREITEHGITATVHLTGSKFAQRGFRTVDEAKAFCEAAILRNT